MQDWSSIYKWYQ